MTMLNELHVTSLQWLLSVGTLTLQLQLRLRLDVGVPKIRESVEG